MRSVAKYFFQGLIFLVPILLTLWLLYASITTIDGWFGFSIPGLGVGVTLVLVIAVGILANHFFTQRILRFLSGLLDKLPFIKILHTAIKDLLSAVVGDKRRFDKPVLVRLGQGSSAKIMGFVTRESMAHWGMDDHVAVYLPQSYNFAGQLLVVAKKDVTPLSVESAEVMTFIVSGGISGKDTPPAP